MADESDTAPTPTASKREESGGLGGEDESAEPSTPAPRASGPRRSSKRPVVPVMDPESNLSPTVARSRKRQAIAGDRAGGGGAETEEDAFAKDREIKRLQQDLNEQKMVVKKGRQMLAQSLVELAKNEREKIRTKLCHDGLRLGKYKTSTFGQSDAWEGGSEEEQIKQLKKMLHEERNSVEQTRRSLKSQTKKEKEEGQTKKIEKEEDEPKEANEEDDTMEVREVCAHRLEYIKREDLQIKERESRLSAERTVHQKQRMLVNAEDRSRFRHYAILKDKYQLLNMIGRGGFSEIWKAFDLDQMCFCAIKINEIEAKMTDAQRQDLVRWALREYEIQKKLQHPRIVQLRDCFALDNHAFVLVLELCEGETLDLRLKTLGPLPEKEAKSIIVQMLSGLRYLNSSGRKIIHYDIKPSNLFYHAGQVKIGDFGLSKMADTPHPEGVIDLSTRGAGTSWYLPPECHEIASPTINSKVDVWSTGVVFFELLFGRRPFGEGQSQDAFRREGSFDLTMPTAPRVSNEAKEFLKRLLIRDRDQRPDVHEALQDPYIRPVKANDTRR